MARRLNTNSGCKYNKCSLSAAKFQKGEGLWAEDFSTKLVEYYMIYKGMGEA
jgi:hypothetical protein